MKLPVCVLIRVSLVDGRPVRSRKRPSLDDLATVRGRLQQLRSQRISLLAHMHPLREQAKIDQQTAQKARQQLQYWRELAEQRACKVSEICGRKQLTEVYRLLDDLAKSRKQLQKMETQLRELDAQILATETTRRQLELDQLLPALRHRSLRAQKALDGEYRHGTMMCVLRFSVEQGIYHYFERHRDVPHAVPSNKKVHVAITEAGEVTYLRNRNGEVLYSCERPRGTSLPSDFRWFD